MLKLSHKRLRVWQAAVGLAKRVYATTRTFPSEEAFGLTSQLRRGSVSVASNIAEGAARRPGGDRRRFYEIARASLVELDTQLEICLELGYIDSSEVSSLAEEMNRTFALLCRMVDTA